MTTHEFVLTPPRAITTRIWPMLLVFTSYLIVAHLGLASTALDGIATPAWGPPGIAIAALVLGGRQLWPAVLAAAFAAYAMNGAALPLAGAIAIGNTLAVLSGAMLLERLAFSPAIDRMRDVARLALASTACAGLASLVGVAALWTTDEVPTADIAYRVSLWWTGDFTSACIVAPVILAVVVAVRTGRLPSGRGAAELATALAGLALLVAFVASDESRRFPALIVPCWAWATIRFRVIGGSIAALIVVSIGQLYVIDGQRLIDSASTASNMQASQLLPTIAGLSLLLLAAALTERDAARATAERAFRDEHQIAQQLRQVDEMKDHLLAAVSHELRTPLTSILALSSLLHDGADWLDRAKVGEMSGKLEGEARRLDQLLTDLLDLERLRMGLLEPRYERVDVTTLVRASVDRSVRNPRETKLELDPIMIDADSAKLERIVDNLIGNADKHTPIDGQITVSTRTVDGGVVIAVDDEGLGVPDEFKDSVFEPFNRGATNLAEVQGSGIGLSLVARFTAMHGGSAWVEDRPEGGSSFRVFLPGERVAD